MGNWADLPPELLTLIAQKIRLYRDFFFFGLVCKPWQSVTSSISNFDGPEPTRWLLLTANEEADEECSLFGLVKGLTTKLVLPEIKGKRCFESLGWLLTISGDGEVSLLNPFSRVQVSLPSVYGLEYFRNKSGDVGANLSVISKMVLSSNPSETENYMVIVIYCTCELMGMWKAGDPNWTRVPTASGLYDILYYNRRLYYVAPDPYVAHDPMVCCITGITDITRGYGVRLYYAVSTGRPNGTISLCNAARKQFCLATQLRELHRQLRK